mgnify:FL=1
MRTGRLKLCLQIRKENKNHRRNVTAIGVESMNSENVFEMNLKSFCNEQYYNEAASFSHDEIIKKYGDTSVPIAIIPGTNPIFKGIWSDAKNNIVYTGLGSFIDHWVNHHPEMDAEDLLNIQEVLKAPDNLFYEEAKNAVIFDKRIDGVHDVVILKKASDKLIYERSNYMPKKLPKRWIEISKETGQIKNKELSFVDGHPTISQSDKTEAGIVRNISTLNDTSNISQLNRKSSNSLIPKKPSKLVDTDFEIEP